MSKKINNSQDAVKIARGLVKDYFKEHLIAIYLNARNVLIKAEVVSVGSMTANIVHPREVFRPALINRAYGLILLHNHPSGELEPSEADRQITIQLVFGGELLGVHVVDHVIFARGKKNIYSLV